MHFFWKNNEQTVFDHRKPDDLTDKSSLHFNTIVHAVHRYTAFPGKFKPASDVMLDGHSHDNAPQNFDLTETFAYVHHLISQSWDALKMVKRKSNTFPMPMTYEKNKLLLSLFPLNN